MAGALLRTGSLRDFRALGAVGNPVYSAAGQLRAAIQRHLGAAIADLFAIPRQNDRGDAIDWYAPQAGDVVPWSAARPEQRAAAKATLLAARRQLAAHSQALQTEDRSERQVFGQLLTQVTHIPSDDHIYLVKDSPVMTFWGFHPLDAPPGLDVLADLRTAVPPPAVGPVTTPMPAHVPVEPERRPWWWWLLLPLLLLALLIVLLLLRSCGVDVPLLSNVPFVAVPDATATPLTASQREVFEDGRRYIADAERGVLIDPETGREVRPLRPDELTAMPSPAVPADAAPDEPPDREQATPPQAPPEEQPSAPTPAAPAAAPTPADAEPPDDQPNAPTPPAQPAPAQQTPGAKEPPRPPGEPPAAPAGTPLTIPEAAVQEGSTDFLNGRWRSNTGVTDDKGNPVELDYEFKNGQGTVSLRRSVGDTQHICSGRVGSNLRQGKLRIDQQGVRCPDGVTFQDSSVECSVGEGGKAVCQGSNADGTKYDVSIVK